MALSISNSVTPFHDSLWQEREDEYLTTMNKYPPEEWNQLCEMTAWLIETLDEGPDDVLGDIYMKSGMGSKAAGQFFTPFHLSELTAKLSVESSIESLKEEMTILEINEPACGGGGMIIAVAKILHDEGINYQKQIKVVAQDLDWKGVYMCYVQLSFLGINAICVQGDTLMEPFDPSRTHRRHILYTPKNMGALV